ncbi:regulator of chromosome condensation RCC1 [Desulfatibacillum aliphaticivorans]|uniref:Regulator of chromosome condensation RCC1 n=1 Tax=Desulfatibacillum aliphaticivorans TaxID=218208 RepID=B8F9K6_DESAL|nr:chromosome condensation regulator RCC1 [Desulfatibacillum aliphaticivorans]ACL02952.1 regulator of chromosome condensation RCC1 [Desulfatibacillum aliphaticivorans]
MPLPDSAARIVAAPIRFTFIILLLGVLLPVFFLAAPYPVFAADSGCNFTGSMLAAGLEHSLALKQDGTVWAWGANGAGQLGLGDNLDRSGPEQVMVVSNIVSLAAGKYFSLALASDGAVWAWGGNNFGQLGLGDNKDCLTPSKTLVLSNVAALAGGDYHALAATQTGEVLAWGRNNSGQLGFVGDNADAPVRISGLDDVSAVAAGEYFSLALKNDGTVWAWGSNGNAQLGTGIAGDSIATPTAISVLSNITAIAAGKQFGLALAEDGPVRRNGHWRRVVSCYGGHPGRRLVDLGRE